MDAAQAVPATADNQTNPPCTEHTEQLDWDSLISPLLQGVGAHLDFADVVTARLTCKHWGVVLSSSVQSLVVDAPAPPRSWRDAVIAAATIFPRTLSLSVNFTRGVRTDVPLHELQAFRHLETLELKDMDVAMDISSFNIQALAGLPRLRQLTLSCMLPLGAEELQPLAACSALESLIIRSILLGEPCMQALAMLSQLRHLCLDSGRTERPETTDLALHLLPVLHGLRALELGGGRAMAALPAVLQAMTALHRLRLGTGADISDDVLQALADASQLRCLQLSAASLPPRWFATLARMTFLTQLQVSGSSAPNEPLLSHDLLAWLCSLTSQGRCGLDLRLSLTPRVDQRVISQVMGVKTLTSLELLHVPADWVAASLPCARAMTALRRLLLPDPHPKIPSFNSMPGFLPALALRAPGLEVLQLGQQLVGGPEELRGLSGFLGLQELDIGMEASPQGQTPCSRVTAALVALPLGQLTRLRSLKLTFHHGGFTTIPTEAAGDSTGCGCHCQATDSVSAVPPLPASIRFVVVDGRLCDSILQALCARPLRSMTSLELPSSIVSSQGLAAALHAAPRLRDLKLTTRCSILPDVLADATQLLTLTRLELLAPGLGPPHLAAVAQLTTLRSLALLGSFGAADISQLTVLTNLRTVCMYGCADHVLRSIVRSFPFMIQADAKPAPPISDD